MTTTVRRRSTLLPRTVASLAAAGFPDPRLFVDGDCDSEHYKRHFPLCELTLRYPAVKTYANWMLAAAELYVRQPRADRYALFQDDLVAVKNLRKYLERCNYQKNTYWNLYTFPENHPHTFSGQKARCAVCNSNATEQLHRSPTTRFYQSNQLGRGAVALVFTRLALMTLLQQRSIVQKPATPSGTHNLDGAIIDAMKQAGYKEVVHLPSLIQHTGTVSSMGSNQQPEAPSFPGENFDAMSFFSSNPTPAVIE